MVNPILTILFDIAVIGATAALFAYAIAEARSQRRGAMAVPVRPFRRHAISRQPARLNRARNARPRIRIAA